MEEPADRGHCGTSSDATEADGDASDDDNGVPEAHQRRRAVTPTQETTIQRHDGGQRRTTASDRKRERAVT